MPPRSPIVGILWRTPARPSSTRGANRCVRSDRRSVANGVTKDKAAVTAAIASPWSNGQTEGQITKLKLVKRQIYGRAKLALLEARLIGAG